MVTEQDGAEVVGNEYGYEFEEFFMESVHCNELDEWLLSCAEEGTVVLDSDSTPSWIEVLLRDEFLSEEIVMEAHLEAETSGDTVAAGQLLQAAEEEELMY